MSILIASVNPVYFESLVNAMPILTQRWGVPIGVNFTEAFTIICTIS